MAQKPTVSLPDVFAKPGRAPSRGTPIEDLPASATMPEEAVAAEKGQEYAARGGVVEPGGSPDAGSSAPPETIVPVVAVDAVGPPRSDPDAVTALPVAVNEAPEISKPAEADIAPEAIAVESIGAIDAGSANATPVSTESVSAESVAAPPVVAPSVVAPSVAAPPVVTSPVVTSPVVAPPVVAPPVVTSPVVAPPVVAPPAVAPSVVAPSVAAPPVVAPPVATPPVAAPSVAAPPVVAPPVAAPPVVASPVVAPPVVAPPVAAPPVAAPPVVAPSVVAPSVVQSPAPTATAAVPSAPRITPGSGSPPIMTSPQMSQAANPMPASGANSTWGIAVAALVVGLTVPIWQDPVQRTLGITTAVSRAQQEDALTLARLERKQQDLEQRLASTTAQLTKAQGELAQAVRRQEDAAAWLRAMALTRLGDALRRSSPFAPDLAVARGAGVNLDDIKPMLDKIGPFVSTGVPTNADLDREFRRMADQITRTGRGMVPAEWMATLVSWTSFNRAPPPPADPAPDLVRAAAANVADGNYAAAIEQLKQITGPYEQVFAGWIEDAQARMAADSIVKRVDEVVDRAVRPAAK